MGRPQQRRAGRVAGGLQKTSRGLGQSIGQALGCQPRQLAGQVHHGVIGMRQRAVPGPAMGAHA